MNGERGGRRRVEECDEILGVRWEGGRRSNFS